MRPAYSSITEHATFRLDAPQAQGVQVIACLIKDDAKPVIRTLHKGLDGVWILRVELARGRYVYRFLVDNSPMLDPSARYNVTDDQGGEWNMREIGY